MSFFKYITDNIEIPESALTTDSFIVDIYNRVFYVGGHKLELGSGNGAAMLPGIIIDSSADLETADDTKYIGERTLAEYVIKTTDRLTVLDSVTSAALVDLNNKIKNLENNANAGSDVDSVELNSLITRVDALDKNTSAALVDLNNKIVTLQSSINSGNDNTSYAADIASINQRLGILDISVTANTSTLNGVEPRVTTLETKVKNNDTSISSFDTSIKFLENHRKIQDTSIESLTSTLTDVSTLVGNQSKTVDDISTLLRDVSTRLGNLSTSSGGDTDPDFEKTTSAALTDLNNKYVQIQVSMNELKAQIEALKNA